MGFATCAGGVSWLLAGNAEGVPDERERAPRVGDNHARTGCGKGLIVHDSKESVTLVDPVCINQLLLILEVSGWIAKVEELKLRSPGQPGILVSHSQT